MSFALLFYISLAIVCYTYIGYGILIATLVFFKKRIRAVKQHDTPSILPDVTLFITAYNEEAVVNSKMNNSLEINYPKDKLHIYWITDGSNDRTNEILQAYEDVVLLHQPERKGKTAAINRGMDYISSEIVVFTDANTLINKDAIRHIVNCFANEKVGCVSGEKRIEAEQKDKASAGGESAYWRYESTLKWLDSELYSAVGAAGELFAIRSALFEAIPEDSLLDDFMLSMKIAQKGYKIAYCKEAYAIEKGSKNMQEEEKRKVRIAAGGLQSVGRLLPLLNIFRYGCLSFQYISHRVLRWTITPVALMLLLPLNILLVIQQPTATYIIFFLLQVVFYIAAAIGWYLSQQSIKHKFLFIPYYFLFMNTNVFKGMIYLARNKGKAIWEKAERS